MWLDVFNKMRMESGMSLDEISQKSGVPRGTLAKISSGITKSPALETMRSLVHAMGYTLDDLEEKAPTPSDDDAGAKLAVEEVIAAFVAAGIVPEGQDLSDEDLKFFSSILAAVSQWFAA